MQSKPGDPGLGRFDPTTHSVFVTFHIVLLPLALLQLIDSTTDTCIYLTIATRKVKETHSNIRYLVRTLCQ